MSLTLSAYLLAVLPAATFLAVSMKPSFLDVPQSMHETSQASKPKGVWTAITLISCLIVVPVMLYALGSDAQAAAIFASFFSSVAACIGASRVGGLAGLAAALALIALALVSALGHIPENALSILAGLGGGYLLAWAFAGRTLVLFCLAFAVLDVVIVGSGLVARAVDAMPMPGAFVQSIDALPLFNRIELGDSLLGSGDIAFATLVAAIFIRGKVSKHHVVIAACLYLVATLIMVAYSISSGHGVPATLPGVVALSYYTLTKQRGHQAAS